MNELQQFLSELRQSIQESQQTELARLNTLIEMQVSSLNAQQQRFAEFESFLRAYITVKNQ